MLIAGDIGGTKTDLAIYSSEGGPHAPLAQTQVKSADYPSLQAIVEEFLAGEKLEADVGCFDVAGPVIEGRVKTTNLPWEMEEGALARALGLKSVHLMNDLEAVARAVPILRPQDLVTLSEGRAAERGAIAVVAPGTGLGESFLAWSGAGYQAHSSEGGHSDFAPTDARQIGLLQYLLERFDHVGFERVCSGIGIPNVYEYLRDRENIPESPAVAAAIAAAPDRTKAICDAALDPRHPSALCRATIETVVSILGSEAGNLGLKVLATGGVYLAGGISLRLLEPIREPRFLEAFRRKGRFRDLMTRMPVHVITTRAAMTGAAAYGLERLRDANAGPRPGRMSS
ncbi:MAG TPA: glucokinase [Candidatus Polarisedimenticolia bacterium]|nr:glucokinase [Candidatus Polarisedimenticolia bacterium]